MFEIASEKRVRIRRYRLKHQASIFYVEDDPILARVLKWRLETLG